jgi:hypothetical protein
MSESLPTVSFIYQVDLSDALPGFDYTLCVFPGEVPLTAHTAETRAAARNSDPSLRELPDDRLTHFSPVVEVPAGAACRVHIAGTPSGGSGPAYAHLAAITIPPREHHGPPVIQPLDYVSTARAFLFHHPDLMTEDCALATMVMEHMTADFEAAAAIVTLARSMEEQGPPRETGKAWARLVRFKDADGVTHYLEQPSEKTRDDARRAMGRIQVTVKNDLRLKDRKWTQEQGFSVVTDALPLDPTLVAFIGAHDIAALNEGEATVKADVTTRLHGVRTFVSKPSTPGSGIRAHLRIENYFLRFLGGYIQFLNIHNDIISTPGWRPDHTAPAPPYIDQRDDLRWLDGLGSTETIFGAPDPDKPGRIEHDITFPEGTVAARVYALGLGTGDNPYPGPALYGAIRTALINLAIPALLLGAGTAVRNHKELQKLFDAPETAQKVYDIGKRFANYVGGDGGSDAKVDWPSLSVIAQTLFQTGLETIAKYIGKALTRYIPFAGWIMAAIDVAIAIAQITQTIVAVATSPWAIRNRLATSIQTPVTVLPDPVVKAFPPGGSRSLNVRLIYQSGHPTMSVTIAVAAGSVEKTLKVELTNNLGGLVRFQTEFLVGSEVAASASTDWLPNDGVATRAIELFLFQKRVALTKDSFYEHAALLTFTDNRYQWTPTKEAPRTTRGDLGLPEGNAISLLIGLSLSQRHHQLGYAWKADGLGIVNCAGQTPETQLYALQSVDIPGLPMDDARFSECGYSSLANIVYDPYPPRFKMTPDGKQYETDPQGRPIPDPDSRDLGLYYIDPTAANRPSAEGGGYHLRKIADGGTAPINRGGPSYGRFPLPIDSVVIHPSGRVVAINHQLSEFLITTLEPEGRSDDQVPFARRVGGPAIDYTPPGGAPTHRRRPGLLANPIAVASTYDGTVIVLESIQQLPQVSRLQAFDGDGNPVNAFREEAGAWGPFLDLPTGRTYLDLAVAGSADLTDIFILYYTGGGKSPDDYHLDVYQTGCKVPRRENSFLLTTPRVSAAALAVDLFRTLYTLNWSMTTDGKGNLAGPRIGPTGPLGRTVPSLSQWLPKETA